MASFNISSTDLGSTFIVGNNSRLESVAMIGSQKSSYEWKWTLDVSQTNLTNGKTFSDTTTGLLASLDVHLGISTEAYNTFTTELEDKDLGWVCFLDAIGENSFCETGISCDDVIESGKMDAIILTMGNNESGSFDVAIEPEAYLESDRSYCRTLVSDSGY